jgi:hypothetical protein
MHEADLELVSTVSSDQLAVDEKLIRIDGDDFWLYGAVDPETNEVVQLRSNGHETDTAMVSERASSTLSTRRRRILSMTPITW